MKLQNLPNEMRHREREEARLLPRGRRRRRGRRARPPAAAAVVTGAGPCSRREATGAAPSNARAAFCHAPPSPSRRLPSFCLQVGWSFLIKVRHIFHILFFSIILSFLLIRIFKYLFKSFSSSVYYANISFFLSHIYTQVNPSCFSHCNSFSSKLKLLPTSHIHSCINVATLSKCKTSNSMKALVFLTQIIM